MYGLSFRSMSCCRAVNFFSVTRLAFEFSKNFTIEFFLYSQCLTGLTAVNRGFAQVPVRPARPSE